MFVVLIPSLGAALVAGSRIMDARHHPFDVLSGSLIGIIIGWAAYRQYFPPVSDYRAKGRAYPIVSVSPCGTRYSLT
jgi:diacylglycerol diphosphate phosphatase / phosphatidate phosphatase